MLGHRGAASAITYPEIYEMQVRAIVEAACHWAADTASKREARDHDAAGRARRRSCDLLRPGIDRVAAVEVARKRAQARTIIGTMIEVPRAALRAGEIAETAEFFSFGTNDLTQTVYGLSRDDAASFIPTYERAGILPNDPFASIDVDGVGELVSLAVERGRKTRDALKLGICGEHGGDPASSPFCHAARPQLRLLLTLPRPHRATCRCTSGGTILIATLGSQTESNKLIARK